MYNLRTTLFPIGIGGGGLLLMSTLAYLLSDGTLPAFNFFNYNIVNQTLTMQLMVLPFSSLALVLLYLYRRDGFKMFFRFGSLFSHDHSWNFFGPIAATIFTLSTGALMSLAITAQNGIFNTTFYRLLPTVILVSVTNAWSEEIFSRVVIVGGLYQKLTPRAICWISAFMFGIPHFFGTPGRLFGVVTSGLLGWVLARSVIETKGMGWAWIIHFLQDIMIFGAGAAIISGQQ